MADLYPELSEQGKEDAQKLIDEFKDQISKAASETISKFYTDVSVYIESDHWTNYRNKIVDGFRNYGGGQADRRIDFRELRDAVYREHRDELIKDLNQDLVEEVEQLRKQVDRMEDRLMRRDEQLY